MVLDLLAGAGATGSTPPPRTSWQLVAAVAGSGAVGVTLRYLVGVAAGSRMAGGFPWSTLMVNVLGAFALGVLLAACLERGVGPPLLLPVVGVGLLGGFTTFSTFALEAVALVEAGRLTHAAAYVGLTNVVGLAAAVAGLALGRLLT